MAAISEEDVGAVIVTEGNADVCFFFFYQKHTRFTLGFVTEEKKQTKKIPVILHSITSRATAEPLKD